MPVRHPPIARLTTSLAALVVVFASMGASCNSRLGSPFGMAGPPAPVVLSNTSSSADIVAAVNANSARVQTYQAQQASVSLPESAGLPLVSASIAVERPLRFRLRATTALTGPEIDLGSNDERFWIWARRNEPPALYTARHEQWAASPVRAQAPIEPAWLIDALGLTQLDPGAAYVGPLPRDGGTVELRTQIATPSGMQQRVLILDAQTAWVREQHLYDERGSLAASVFADDFRYDPATQTSLPERVRLSVPASGLDLTINTGPITINAPVADGGQLWSLPNLGSYPVVDLTAPGGAPAAASAWDLTGVGATYGRSAPIATPYSDWSPTPGAAQQPLADAAAANNGWKASPASTPAPGFTGPKEQPLALPPTDGFTGLPPGGRAL